MTDMTIDKEQTVPFNPKRLESQKLVHAKGTSFAHSHLIDVSGKRQVFEQVDFSYSVMTRGYFHLAEFRRCDFTGTRFIDCNFRNAVFEDCDFSYSDFTGCRIETDEILRNLPDRPNVRRELLQILRKNALSIGDVSAGRAFVIAELAAKKEHLRRAWIQDEAYYKKKYSGLKSRLNIAMQRVALWFDGFLWGHGERLWNLPISVGVILSVISFISASDWVYSVPDPSIADFTQIFVSYMKYYVSLFLDAPHKSEINQLLFIDWLVVIFRYISLGVLVSGLFRWLSHR